MQQGMSSFGPRDIYATINERVETLLGLLSIRRRYLVALKTRLSDEIKADVRALNARRKEAQPTNRRTFGSVFKNPDHDLSAGRMLEACGLKGHRIGGAQISPKHANFIENAGGARTEDALALIAEARRRAREQYGVELVHEVQLLGDIEIE